MSWRLARSLSTLRAEFNALAPNRSKRSDGTIGDPAHAARASRHNPNRHGVVTALDITHDPASGCDVHAIARQIAANPHPELRYIVSNGQIAERRNGFAWRSYGGSNPHTKHAHFAVGTGPDSAPEPPYDSTAPWGVSSGGHTVSDRTGRQEDIMRQGDNGPRVAAWQDRLKWLGIDCKVDGDFGPATVAATQKAQQMLGLGQDGEVHATEWALVVATRAGNELTEHSRDKDKHAGGGGPHSHKATVTLT